MKRSSVAWALRIIAVLIVLAAALYAFRAGVDVSDRPGLPTDSPLTQLYYSVGLFVLGGMDLGTPVGGPGFARGLLWFAYFAAPAITTSAVIEGILRVVGSHRLDRIGLHHHVVVVGIGRVGMAFVEALRRREPDRQIVVVDRELARANVEQARRRFGTRFIPGDIRLKGTLDQLSLDSASAIVLLTNDDLVNLEAGYAAAGGYPKLAVVVHVSDIAMQRAVRFVGDDAGINRVRVFNRHRLTARHLYDEHLRQIFSGTEPLDDVVLAGFGRFGQTILEFLEAQAASEIGKVIVVDRNGTSRLRAFREQVSAPETSDVHVVDGDIADPAIWDQVAAVLGTEPETPPVIVLGCDVDQINLRGAMDLRRRWPEGRLFVRCQYESAFTEELSNRHDFTVLAIDEVLNEALQLEQHAWLLRDAE